MINLRFLVVAVGTLVFGSSFCFGQQQSCQGTINAGNSYTLPMSCPSGTYPGNPTQTYSFEVDFPDGHTNMNSVSALGFCGPIQTCQQGTIITNSYQAIAPLTDAFAGDGQYTLKWANVPSSIQPTGTGQCNGQIYYTAWPSRWAPQFGGTDIQLITIPSPCQWTGQCPSGTVQLSPATVDAGQNSTASCPPGWSSHSWTVSTEISQSKTTMTVPPANCVVDPSNKAKNCSPPASGTLTVLPECGVTCNEDKCETCPEPGGTCESECTDSGTEQCKELYPDECYTCVNGCCVEPKQ